MTGGFRPESLTKWLADENLDPQTLAKYLDQLGAAGIAQVRSGTPRSSPSPCRTRALLDASFGRIKAKITSSGWKRPPAGSGRCRLCPRVRPQPR